MTTLEVHVTEDDIKNGIGDDPHQCAVALAIKRASGDPLATVGFKTGGPSTQNYLLPDEVREWIEEFDAGYPVAPISFVLSEPCS